MKGHAGYGKHGQDIVCASVSTVTQMIAFELNLKGYASYHIEDGELDVSIDETSFLLESQQLYMESLIEMMWRTLDALSIQYPEQITLKEEY